MHTRATFLSTGALALPVPLLAAATAAGAQTPGPYDFAAIGARLALPFRHRQAFGSYRLADGLAAGLMVNALNAYEFDYADGPGTLHVLGIFYGTSIAMLLDDVAWSKYRIGIVQQRRGDPVVRSAPAGANPYARATSPLDRAATRSDLHGLYHDTSLAALHARLASFFACDNALRGLATDIAVTYGTSDEPVQRVHAELRTRLVPGTLLVPAGVAAVNQAQEMRFTFMPASV